MSHPGNRHVRARGPLGLDSGNYSFAYVARWTAGSTDLIKETVERVIGCAKRILDGLGHDQDHLVSHRPANIKG